MAPLPNARSPSAVETTVSLCVLAVLVAVLAWVLGAQQRFNPAVTVAAMAARQAGKAAAARPGAVQDLVAAWPAGWRPMSAAEAFTPGTLSDKIDGKAELYLSAGFVALACQRVALTNAPGAWVEVFVFDLGRPANAFAAFSAQQRHEAVAANLGDYSYRAGNQLVLVHGKYYIELVAAAAQNSTMEAAAALARSLVAALAVDGHADVSKDQALFPPEGLVADSMQLLSADVFGSDRLRDFFVARYQDGPDRLTLFIAPRGTPAEAAQTGDTLRGFLVKDCGGKETSLPAGPRGAVIVEWSGGFDGIFTSGARVAGVHEAPSRDAAERWMKRLQQNLQPGQP